MDNNVCSLMFFVLIYSQCHQTDSTVLGKTFHMCNYLGNNPSGDTPNFTCPQDDLVRWIGFQDLGFGLLPNGTNCSAIDSSAISISATKNSTCVQSFTTMLALFDLFSGKEPVNPHTLSVHDYCKQDSAYFIAKYDCVLYKKDEDLHFDQACNYSRSGNKMNIASSGYPRGNISRTGDGSCSCSALVTGSQMVLKTYDNRLIHNQSFMLTYENKTLIKEWKKVNKMEGIMNITYIDRPFTRTHLMLKWTNNAASNGGKLWIVLEVNGTITVTCQHHKATTASLPTTTSMSSSILSTLNSSPWNSSPVASAGQSNKSSSSIPASMQSQYGTCNEPKNASDRRVNIIKLLAGVAGGLFAFIILMCCCVLICSKKRPKTEPERQPANKSFQNQYERHGKQNPTKK